MPMHALRVSSEDHPLCSSADIVNAALFTAWSAVGMAMIQVKMHFWNNRFRRRSRLNRHACTFQLVGLLLVQFVLLMALHGKSGDL